MNLQYIKLTFYSAVCNTTLTEESGVLRSPGYPSAVYENITCTYTFKQTNQRLISLDFTDFSLPPKVNGTCETYVKVTNTDTLLIMYLLIRFILLNNIFSSPFQIQRLEI